MNEAQVFILSEQAFSDMVARIQDDQWTLKLPEWFGLGGTQDRSKVTLRDIINYHAYDSAWVPETLAGKTIAEVGAKYDGDLLGDDPKASYAKYSSAAIAAATGFTDFDQVVHLSYGDWPAKEYLKHITSFRGFRAYDLAKLIGADTKLPDDLVHGMWDEFVPEAEEWRKLGVYGPEVKVPPDADLQTRLLGLAGRKP